MNIKEQLEQAAQTIAGLVHFETPVTACYEVVLGKDRTASGKYSIRLGDVCDRGPWKWVCVWGATADEAIDAAHVACAEQADKKALEIRDLTKRALELGLVVTEAEGKQNV